MHDDNKIYKTDSTAGVSSITTGDYGDDTYLSTVRRIKPRFLRAPLSAAMTNYFKRNLGDTLAEGQTIAMNDGKFDMLKSSRWHRFKIEFTGNHEITGIDVSSKVDGTR